MDSGVWYPFRMSTASTFPITIPKGTAVYTWGRNRPGGFDPNYRECWNVKKAFRISEAHEEGEWVVWMSWGKKFAVQAPVG